jgi:hypothetical protein
MVTGGGDSRYIPQQDRTALFSSMTPTDSAIRPADSPAQGFSRTLICEGATQRQLFKRMYKKKR